MKSPVRLELDFFSAKMRTSRVSKDTAKAIQARSPPSSVNGRRTRSSAAAANALQSFAFGHSSVANSSTAPRIKGEAKNGHESDNDTASSLSSADTADIEDLLEPPRKRKRRRTSDDAFTSPPAAPLQTATRRNASPKVVVKEETATTTSNEKETKSRRLPARKITKKTTEGAVTEMQPPSNWESMYSIVKDMRARNPTAPVDTMGCAELYCRSSSPRDRRFQTLIALMLSSQTKDTVTAVAMQRLHTELGPVKKEAASPIIKEEEDKDEVQGLEKLGESTLTLENVLEVSPTRLDELIQKVGFHNNKTKYIKSTAAILRDEFDSDIPSTPKGLMRLPGVGPKMAFLCMSSAWGLHEGIGVDVHVHRITNLWGWHKTSNPEATRVALESWLPKDKWHEINKLLVGLGQTVCLPVGRRCGECDLAGTGLCKAEIKGWKPKVKKEVKSKESPGNRVKKEEEVVGGTKIKVEQ